VKRGDGEQNSFLSAAYNIDQADVTLGRTLDAHFDLSELYKVGSKETF